MAIKNFKLLWGILVVLNVETFAQIKTCLEWNFSEKTGENSVHFLLYEIDSSNFKTKRPKEYKLDGQKQSKLTFIQDFKQPLLIYMDIDLVFLIEPGDSLVFTSYRNDSLKISGKGSYRLRMMKTVKKVIKELPKPKVDSNSLIKYYLEIAENVRKRQSTVLSLISASKDSITNFEYQYIRTFFLTELERKKLLPFQWLITNPQRTNLSNKDLMNLYDLTIANSPLLSIPLTNTTVLINSFITDAYYRLNRFRYLRENNFDEKYMTENKRVELINQYLFVKREYIGIPKMRMLEFIVKEFMPRYLQQSELEKYIDDFIALPGFDGYKEEIKAYRNVFLKNNLAPELNLPDINGNYVKLQNLVGKIILIDFWFTGCSGCVKMAQALSKVEQTLSTDTGVVFVNISTDNDKEKWLKSVKERKYTSGTGICLFTDGKGFDHPVLTNYLVQSYPTLILIDKKGRIYTSSIPNPTENDGKSIIELIKSIRD